MRVLADTSVWVEYLRRGAKGPARGLDPMLSERSVVVCGPVAAELLKGTDEGYRATVWSALTALEWVDLDQAAWRTVGEAAGTLRSLGTTVALRDVSVAVAAVIADAALWTRDAAFKRIRRTLPDLRLYEPKVR